MFKSDTQPRCRGCGKLIAKHTRTVFFGQGSVRDGDYVVMRPERPKTREEAQTLTNERIISMNWHRHVEGFGRIVGNPSHDYVSKIGVWDGETYVDEFFHSQQCAADLGRAMARAGWALKPYNDITNASTPA